MSDVLTAQQIECLRKALEDKKVASKIAESRVAEIEKQIWDEFGVTVEEIPTKMAEFSREADVARAKLQEEYAEFNELWAAATVPITNSTMNSSVTINPTAKSPDASFESQPFEF